MTKQSRSENTRLHLVRSAAELFDRNGFAGATLADVSRSAGVTKGAFYFHFSSKDELAGAIQAEACALLRDAVAHASRADTPVLQSLIDLTHELAGWLTTESLVRASFRTARECGHRGAPFLDFYGDWATALRTLLRAARDADELAPGVDIEQALTLVLTISAGLEMLWWTGIRGGGISVSLAGLWVLVVPGLAAPELAAQLRPAGSGTGQG